MLRGLLVAVLLALGASACAADDNGTDDVVAPVEFPTPVTADESGDELPTSEGDESASDSETDDDAPDLSGFCLDSEFPARLRGLAPQYTALNTSAAGTPVSDPLLVDGVFFFQTQFGAHVRVFDRSAAPGNYVITLESSVALDQANPTVEPTGTGSLSLSGNVLQFSTIGSDQPAGFDFGLCRIEQLRLTVERNGALVEPSSLFIGTESISLDNPVSFERR